MAQVFLSTSQDGVVRLMESSDQKYVGLHTTGVQTCWVIILISKDKKRMSLIHKTSKTDIQSIADEIIFVTGDNPLGLIWYVVHNVDFNGGVFVGEFEHFKNQLSQSLHCQMPECIMKQFSDFSTPIVVYRNNGNVELMELMCIKPEIETPGDVSK